MCGWKRQHCSGSASNAQRLHHWQGQESATQDAQGKACNLHTVKKGNRAAGVQPDTVKSLLRSISRGSQQVDCRGVDTIRRQVVPHNMRAAARVLAVNFEATIRAVKL
jgi:hypothetical protein